jgi:PAS domain S-box-containing protein
MPPALATQNSGKARRVLIVDDDPEFAEGLELLLTAEKYDVGLAHDAAAAKEVIGRFTPEVALIDIRLAGSSGINLISELHEKRPDILCIMITAFASTDTAIEAIHAGAYDYLCKPFHGSDLFATLDRCFERILLTREKATAEAALVARNEELEQINKRLQLVVRSMQNLTHYSTLRELCPRVQEEVARNMAADGGSVYLREGDQLVLKHALDPGHAPRTISFPLSSESVFGAALDSKSPVLLSEIGSGHELLPSGWTGYEDRSLLAFPLLGDDGEEIGVLSLHAKRAPPFTEQDRDIGLILISFICETIRAVQALEGLAKSEERFRSLVENSPFCIHEMDLSGRMLAMNKAGIEMVDLGEAGNFEGMDYLEFVAPAERERVANLLGRARAGEVCHFEFETGENGASRIFESCFAPLRDPDGTVHKIMGITQDVTERKRGQEQLLQAQKMQAVGQLTGGDPR